MLLRLSIDKLQLRFIELKQKEPAIKLNLEDINIERRKCKSSSMKSFCIYIHNFENQSLQIKRNNTQPMKSTANLLNSWFRDFEALSSELAIVPFVHRTHVESIYQSLLNFFGIQFFEVN